MSHLRRAAAALAAAAALTAAPAVAGNLSEPQVEPIVPPPPVVVVERWTGGYAGVQLGFGRLEGEQAYRCGDEFSFVCDVVERDTVDASGMIAGIHVGFMHDMGSIVLGGELDYDRFFNFEADILPNGNASREFSPQAAVMPVSTDLIEYIARLKLRVGFDMGDTLPYLTAGPAVAGFDTFGSQNGWFAGAGVSYLASEDWMFGVEALFHRFEDIGDDPFFERNADVVTLTLRASRRF